MPTQMRDRRSTHVRRHQYVLALIMCVGLSALAYAALTRASHSPVSREPRVVRGIPAPTNDGCHATGCSGEVCDEGNVVSTCVYRPEFACLETAICERQSDGQCGWTKTPAIESCYAEKRAEPSAVAPQ